MILLISLILLTTIWCIGVTIVTYDEMALHSIRKYAEARAREGKIIFEPLIVCVWCMPSIHSLFGYAFAVGMGLITEFSWGLVVMYPLVAMGSSFLSGMSWLFFEYMDNKKKYYENSEKLTYFQIKDKKEQYKKDQFKKSSNKYNG